MRRTLKILVFLIVAGLVAGSGYAFWGNGDSEAPSYRLAAVERGALVTSVAATGTVNAVVLVQVGSQISGQIRELHADYNAMVKRGQLVARIDPPTYIARVDQAQAELDIAKANILASQVQLERTRADLETGRAQLSVLAAQIASAQAELDHAKRDLERKLALGRADAISLSERERSKADHDRAVAALAAANAQERGQRANLISVEAAIRAADVQIRVAEAVARQKEAAVRAAQVDLDRTEIRSPIDGIVVERNVDVGQTVATSLQSPTLFTIAEDLSRLQVETYVDETDIGRIAPGQRATFTVSAFPNDVFDGTVKQIRKAPQVIQNVVTYIVVIAVANDDQKLLPGMTATIRVITGEVTAAIKVPNAALRFKPVQAAREARPAAAPESGNRRGARRDAPRPGEVYIVAANGEAKSVAVRVGVSDGQFTEIQGDTSLTEGAMVIVGQSRPAPAARRGLRF